jgi:F420-non-reducing hydrogenase iron-sulfur subunit
MNDAFEPVIIGFTCNWCSYRAADAAGTARTKYPPNIRLIRLMCSGRLDATFVIKAFAGGADGVMVAGCHPGDCHYVEQNYKTLRRFKLLQRTLATMGIDPGRLRLVWASAAEGTILVKQMTAFIEEVRALGPLNWPQLVEREKLDHPAETYLEEIDMLLPGKEIREEAI